MVRTAGQILFVLLVAGCSGAAERHAPNVAPESESFANLVIGGSNSQPAPEAISKGKFLVDQKCLLFSVTGGKRYNPIIAGEASVDRTSTGADIVIRGRDVAIGEEIVVVGGGSGDVPNLSSAQRECSDSVFIIGEIIDL